MSIRKLIKFALPGAALLLLAGCFTGIESTPKISERDVKRELRNAHTDNDLTYRMYPPTLEEWHPGRRLLVTDDRLSRLTYMEMPVNEGDILTLKSMGESMSFMGDTLTELVFALPDGSERIYKAKGSISRINGMGAFHVPFTIDLDHVAAVDTMMRGLKYFILTNLRVDSLSNPIAAGRRYIPVTIEGVYPGNDIYPLRVAFIDESGARGSVVMTAGDERAATRNFNRLFTADDPRRNYPQITPEVWQLIIDGKVREGMTLEECRLSLGPPGDIKKGHNGSAFFEIWTYDNGNYLLFQDALLKTFRL